MEAIKNNFGIMLKGAEGHSDRSAKAFCPSAAPEGSLPIRVLGEGATEAASGHNSTSFG